MEMTKAEVPTGPVKRQVAEAWNNEKRKMTRSRDLGLYCLKCGEDGHLVSWCEKEDDDQPQDQNPNSPALGQTSLIDSLAKTDDQDTSAKRECR